MANGSTNLEVQQQITQMYRAQNQLLVAQARLMRGQLAIQTELAAVMQNINPEDLQRRLAPFNQEIDNAISNLDNLSSSGQAAFGNLASGAGSSAGAIDAMGDSLIAAGNNLQRLGIGGAALEGIKKGIDLITETFTSARNIISDVIQGVKDIGTTILGALMGPFEMLMTQARNLPVNTAFFEAREEVRDFFGSLATNEGAAVIDMFHQLKKGIAETGLTARRILGDRAAQLRAMNELAQGLGRTLTAVLDAGLIKNAGSVLVFQRGLGITNEQMKEFARLALVSGRSVDEVLRETSNYAIQMGEAFGISSKLIGRDMAEMSSDMKHFGGLSMKALSEVSVYTRKLGIEIKALAGIMDVFDNLDSAAQAAARLNQQFGIQIDVMQMMKAENPAERAEMLRRSLDQAGVSYANLDRRSKSYLATQIGISEQDAELLFNQNNRGLSLDQIKKKSAEAEKKQLSQAEATKLLADNIKRLAQNMAQLTDGGIFDQLLQGFQDGIMRSADMRRLLYSVREVMVLVYRAGIQIGRDFVKFFPGIKDILGGYADIFNPARWRKSFTQIRNAVKEFFQAIQTDPEGGFRTLWTKLQEIFFGHMDATRPGGMKLIEGFKKFFGTILRVLVGAVRVIVPELIKAMTNGIRQLNRMLRGEGGGLGIDFSGLWNELKTSFMELFNELADLFTVIVPPLLSAFWDALKTLGSTLWSKVGPWFEENWRTILMGLGAVFAAPVVIGAIVSALGAMFSSVIANLFTEGSLSDVLSGVSGEGGGDPATLLRNITGATENASVIQGSIGPLEQLLGNTGTIVAIMAGITYLVSEIKDVAIEMKKANLSTTEVLAGVAAMAAAGLLIGGLVLLAKNLGPREALGIAIATIGGLVANEILPVAIKGFVRIVREDLLGPNGLFISVMSFARGMSNIPDLDQLQTAFKAMEQIGTFLSSMSGFMIGGVISGGINTITSMLREGFETTRNVVGEIASHIPIIGPRLDRVIRPAQQANQSGQQAVPQINQFARIMADLGTGIVAFAASTQILDGMGDISTRMKAVSTILEPLGEFIKAVIPSMQEVVAYSAGAGVNISAATGFLNTLLTDVGKFITTTAIGLNTVGENAINGLKALPNILTGIGLMFKNVTPILPLFKKAENTPPIDTVKISELFTTFSTFINSLLTSSQQLATLNAEQINAIARVYDVIGDEVLGGLVDVLETLTDSDILELAGKGNQLTNFSTFLSGTLTTLFSSFSGSFKEIIIEMRNLAALITPEQAGIIRDVAPLLGGILTGLVGITNSVTDLMKSGLGEAGAVNSDVIQNLLILVDGIFSQIKDLLPGILISINEAFRGVDARGLKNKVTIFSEIVSAISNLSSIISTISNVARENGGSTGDMYVGLGVINSMFKAVPGGVDIFHVIKNILNGFKNINLGSIPNVQNVKKISLILDSMSEISSSVRQIKNNEFTGTIDIQPLIAFISSAASQLATLIIPSTLPSVKSLERLENSFNSISSIASILNRTVANIESGTNDSIGQLLKGLSGNIDLLNNIRPVNIRTSLENLANNIGLGANESLTINNRNFTLQVNLQISMNAETIEEAIVSNTKGTLVITRAEAARFTPATGVPQVSTGPSRAEVPRG